MNETSETRKLTADDKAKIAETQKSLLDEPVAIVGLCRQFGLSVARKDDFPDGDSGSICKNADGTFAIFYDGHDSPTRQRFTVAHELAHYLLHRDSLGDEYPENILFRGGLSNKQETEANWLAAQILMPDDAIDCYTRGRKTLSIQDMARTFGVSPQAMSIRLGIPLDL